MRWLIYQWPYAALLAAGSLLFTVPAIGWTIPLPLLLIYLQLPVYMLHQFEEHYDDRFRKYANATIGGGLNVFTPTAIFLINSFGVWGVDLVCLYVATFVGLGWALAAIYLPLINAVGHVVGALVSRRYNPGLWTALGLFLPFGGWSLWVVSQAAPTTLIQHLVGFGAALLVHALIILHVRHRLASLRSKPV